MQSELGIVFKNYCTVTISIPPRHHNHIVSFFFSMLSRSCIKLHGLDGFYNG